MITLRERVKAAIEGACENVSYQYPSSFAAMPIATYRECGNRTISRAGGIEHIAEVSYAVDIWAKTPEECSSIADDIDAGMAGEHFTRAFSQDLYESASRLHHRAMRYRIIADGAGNVYQ